MAGKKQLKRINATSKVNKAAKPTEVEPLVVNDEEYRCSNNRKMS